MTHELRIERLFDAPPEVVFDTFVDPDAQREMYDGAMSGFRVRELSIDLRVGGTWSLVIGPDDGEPNRATNVFQVVERPHRLVFSSSLFVGVLQQAIDTTVEMTFEDQDGKTLVTIVQTGFETEEDRDGMMDGTLAILDSFGEVLKTRHDSES